MVALLDDAADDWPPQVKLLISVRKSMYSDCNMETLEKDLGFELPAMHSSSFNFCRLSPLCVCQLIELCNCLGI